MIPELLDHDHTHETGVVAVEHLRHGERLYIETGDGVVLVRTHERDIWATRKWERERGFLLGVFLGGVAVILVNLLIGWLS